MKGKLNCKNNKYLLGWILNFLSDIVQVIPTIVCPEACVEGCSNVAQRGRTTCEVGLL